MEHRINPAVQQLGDLIPPHAQIPPMCMDNERVQRPSSAVLRQTYFMYDRVMPWQMQPQKLGSCSFQLQNLQSQRTPSASILTEPSVAKPLQRDSISRSPDLRPCGTRSSRHSSEANLDPLSTPAYSTATTESPILENQAAHTLTTLRRRQDQSQPLTDTCTTSLLCQQQACSKIDCPSSSQVICAAEEIEARICDGNCAGSLCTGIGCPYNLDPYGYHGFENEDCSDFWSCQWACDLETCNITSPKRENSLNDVAHDQSNNHCSLKRTTAFVEERFPQESSRTGQPDLQANSQLHCSIDEFASLMDADEADLDWHFQSRHGQPDSSECHAKDCQTTDTANDISDQHDHSKNRQCSSHSNSSIRSSPSTGMSSSSSPALVQRLETNSNVYTCMWITNQAFGMVCGFSCGHGNDMQAHIETNHIEPQFVSGEPDRRKTATKMPRSLICQWKECKHNLQRKTLRSTQALRQHVFTHSGYRGARCTECGELFVDKANLESHMRRHTGERPFKCKYCEVSFAFRAILITHERTHTGDKVFKCTQCAYKTGDSSNFSRHKLIHKTPQYKCKLCGKDFCRREHLKRHLRNIHEDNTCSSTMVQLPLSNMAFVNMEA